MFAVLGLPDLRKRLFGLCGVACLGRGYRHPVSDVIMALRAMVALAAREQVINVHKDLNLVPGLETPLHAGVACSCLWCVQSYPNFVGSEPQVVRLRNRWSRYVNIRGREAEPRSRVFCRSCT